jgi:hypothetical protein
VPPALLRKHVGKTRMTSRNTPAGFPRSPMIARLLCLVRGGHRWETVEDPAGSLAVARAAGLSAMVTTLAGTGHSAPLTGPSVTRAMEVANQ